MKNAYIMTHTDDCSQWLDGSFSKIDDKKRATFEYNGSMIKDINLRGCIMMHIRATDELISAAPKKFTSASVKKNLPDFGNGPFGGLNLVEEKFVKIIESIEPGVHQFIKIDTSVNKRGEKLEKTMYIMNILQIINALNVEKSNLIFQEWKANPALSGADGKLITVRPGKPFKIVLYESIVRGRALWHGTSKDIYQTFVSDYVADEMNKAGLFGSKLQSVDVE